MKKQTAYLLRLEERLYRRMRARCVRKGETVKEYLLNLVLSDLYRNKEGRT